MELDCTITIILPVDITGSKGTSIRFVPYKQYCFEESLIIDVPCDDNCGVRKIQAWSVELIGQKFIITSKNAMPAGFLRDEDEQLSLDERARKFLLVDNHAKDYKKETLEVIGHDVKAAEKTDYNGEWLQRILEERNNS